MGAGDLSKAAGQAQIRHEIRQLDPAAGPAAWPPGPWWPFKCRSMNFQAVPGVHRHQAATVAGLLVESDVVDNGSLELIDGQDIGPADCMSGARAMRVLVPSPSPAHRAAVGVIVDPEAKALDHPQPLAGHDYDRQIRQLAQLTSSRPPGILALGTVSPSLTPHLVVTRWRLAASGHSSRPT